MKGEKKHVLKNTVRRRGGARKAKMERDYIDGLVRA